MQQILVEKYASPAKLEVMGVYNWPIWSKEVSRFPWEYDKTETCYMLEGEAIVTPEGGEPVTITEGDLVVFPQGMKCEWQITEPVSKHYSFSQ